MSVLAPIIAAVVLVLVAGGLALLAITWFFFPERVECRWDEIGGWFGDWSEEATRPEPYDWSKEMARLGRRRPDSFAPEHIERRRAA